MNDASFLSQMSTSSLLRIRYFHMSFVHNLRVMFHDQVTSQQTIDMILKYRREMSIMDTIVVQTNEHVLFVFEWKHDRKQWIRSNLSICYRTVLTVDLFYCIMNSMLTNDNHAWESDAHLFWHDNRCKCHLTRQSRKTKKKKKKKRITSKQISLSLAPCQLRLSTRTVSG
jgi:hypothetical protein